MSLNKEEIVPSARFDNLAEEKKEKIIEAAIEEFVEKGSIPPGRYSLKWKSDYENRSSLNYMFNFDKKDVKLSSVWGEICCTAYLCRVCRKIIIDV